MLIGVVVLTIGFLLMAAAAATTLTFLIHPKYTAPAYHHCSYRNPDRTWH
jgi:hypothetical protein